jgi:hypothetical protein
MNPQITAEPDTESNLPATEGEMARHGITYIPVDYFHYRQFRYTSLEDAVAQAKRDGAVGPEPNLLTTDVEIAKYGITRSPVDYFVYQKFRYTSLKDALAQATREEATL